MLQSVGQQLKQARLARSLSVEQVAHATKIRPDRVIDLENDELSNFPDLAYAKGFLILYAKYLAVDVSAFTSSLSGSKRVGVSDYEYLQHATPRPGVTARPEPKQSPVAFLVIVSLAIFLLLLIFIVPKLFQVGGYDEAEKKRLAAERDALAAESATPSVSPSATAATATPTPLPVLTPLPMSTPVASALPVATPLPSATPEPTVISVETPVETPTPISIAPLSPDSSVEIRRAEPVRPVPSPQ